MKYLVALLPFALSAFAIAPEAEPSPNIPKPGGSPPGCSPSYDGSFGVSNVYLPGEAPITSSAAHRLMKRTPPAEGPASPLSSTLEDGVLRDGDSRFGYIAANHQYQYDNPIQAGALYTTGWSICPNNTLALGGTTVFWQCTSGDFYNLYDTPIRTGCIAINLQIVPSSGSSSVPVTSSYVVPTSTYVPPSSTYVATSTSAEPTYPSSTPVSSTPISSSTPAPPPPTTYSTSTPAPPPTTYTTPPPATTTSASTAPTYTGAANALALQGSYFAVAAGALGLALI